MHPIEQKINLFLEEVCEGKASFSEELIQEFGTRCMQILRDQFTEKAEKKFTLRMSNLGRPLRQLLLDKQNGGKYTVSKEAKLKYAIGHMYEALMLAVLKQSGVNVVDHDKRVELQVEDTKIYGTYDVKIDGKIYDIKTASPYSYEYKFTSPDTLRKSDSFGYFAQGFGYSLADDSPFGGWIVCNKTTGEFKVISINEPEHDKLQEEYRQAIFDTVKAVNSDVPMPPCPGVVDEVFGKTPTGNRVLNAECSFCEHKRTCHKEIQCLPSVFSKALNAKLTWYIGKVIKPKEKEV